MAKINLLPWREERRKQRQQEFFVILAGAAVLGGLVFMMVSWHIGNLHANQDQRNQTLQNEIAVLDRRIKEIEELETKRARLLARKNVIEELQKNRSKIVHLFDQLVRTVPDGVSLTGIKQEGEKLTLDGVAESNAKVSAYMRSLDDSDWMRNPDLTISEVRDAESSSGDRYRFTVVVTVGRDDAQEEEEGLAP